MAIAPDGKSREFSIEQRGGQAFVDPTVVVLGYASEPNSGPAGTSQTLAREIRRVVFELNKIGFKYEDSGYDVPVTYSLDIEFQLE